MLDCLNAEAIAVLGTQPTMLTMTTRVDGVKVEVSGTTSAVYDGNLFSCRLSV